MKNRNLLFVVGAMIAGFHAQAAVVIDWKASGIDTAWANGGNWSSDPLAPTSDLATHIARFNQASYDFQPDAGTTSIAGIAIGDGSLSPTAPVTLSGTLLTMGSGGLTMYSNADATTISSPVALGASQVWTQLSSNLLTVGSGALSLGGHTLTLAGTGNTLISSTIDSTGGGLVSTGTGTVTLTGLNTYTGATNIGGGTLKLSGADGSLLNAAGCNVSAATLQLDNSVNNPNRLSNISALSFFNGGALLESSGTTETMGPVQVLNGSTTLNVGASTNIATSVGRANGGSINFSGTFNATNKFTVSSIVTGPTANNDVFFNAQVLPTSPTAMTNVFVGGLPAGYFVNGSDFAFYDTALGTVRAPVYGTDPLFTLANTLVASTHGSISTGLTSASMTLRTLKMSGSPSLTLSGQLTLDFNGLLATGGAATIAGNSVRPASNGELVIRVNGGGDSLTFASSAALTNQGTNNWVKTGAGTLALNATANTTSGGTIFVNEGTLQLGSSGTLTGNNAMVVHSLGTFDHQPAVTLTSSALTLDGGTITGGGSAMTLGSSLTSNGGNIHTSGSGNSLVLGGNIFYTPYANVSASIAGNASSTLNIGQTLNMNAAARSIFVLRGNQATDLNISAAITNTDATKALTIAGSGVTVLSGTSTFGNSTNGLILVGPESVTLNGAAGKMLTGIPVTIHRGASLVLDNSSSSLDHRISGTVTMRDGSLNILGGSAALSQTAGNVTTTNTTPGASTISLTPGAGVATVVFGTVTRGTGSTLNLTGGDATNQMKFTNALGLISTGAFYNGADFAYMNALNTYVRAPIYGTDPNCAVSMTASNNVWLSSGTTTQGTAITLNTLKLSDNAGLTATGVVSIGTGTAATTTGAILASGGTSLIDGVGGIKAGSSGAELILRVNGASDVLAITAPIAANGTNALTKSGAGTVTLGNTANAWSGVTYVSEGTLKNTASDVVGAGAMQIATRGVYDHDSFNESVGAITLNGGTITGSGGTLTTTGAVTTTGGSIHANGSGTLSLGGGLTYNADSGGESLLTIGGAVNLNAGRTFAITRSSSNLPVDAKITADIADGSASSSLTFNTANSVTLLSGNNSFTGGYSQSNGNVVGNSQNAFGQSTHASTAMNLTGGTTVANVTGAFNGAGSTGVTVAGGTLVVNASQGLGSATVNHTSGTLRLQAANALQTNILNANGGTLDLRADVNTTFSIASLNPASPPADYTIAVNRTVAIPGQTDLPAGNALNPSTFGKSLTLPSNCTVPATRFLKVNGGNDTRLILSGAVTNNGVATSAAANAGLEGQENFGGVYITGTYSGSGMIKTGGFNAGENGLGAYVANEGGVHFATGTPVSVGDPITTTNYSLQFSNASNGGNGTLFVEGGTVLNVLSKMNVGAINGGSGNREGCITLRGANSQVVFSSAVTVSYNNSNILKTWRFYGDGSANQKYIFQGDPGLGDFLAVSNTRVGDAEFVFQSAAINAKTLYVGGSGLASFTFDGGGTQTVNTEISMTNFGNNIGKNATLNALNYVTWNGAKPVTVGSGVKLTKTGFGTIDFNNALVLQGTAISNHAQFDVAYLGIKDVTVAGRNVLSGPSSVLTGLIRVPALDDTVDHVVLGSDAVVAHATDSTASVANLGTASDLFFGLSTDFTQDLTIGTGTAWEGLSTDIAADRRWTSGTVTVAPGTANVILQGVNGRKLILGTPSGSPPFAFASSAPFTLTLRGAVQFDQASLDMNNVSEIILGEGAAISNTGSFVGSPALTFFYSPYSATGLPSTASVNTLGTLNYKGANTISLTEGAGGSITQVVSSLTRVDGGSIVVIPNAGIANLGAGSLANRLQNSAQGTASLVVPSIISQASAASTNGTFLAYTTANGYKEASYTSTNLLLSSSSDMVDVTATTALDSSAYAAGVMRLSADVTQNTGTVGNVNLGGIVPNETGIIANGTVNFGATTAGAVTTLGFGANTPFLYVNAGGAFNTGALTLVTGTAGLVKFGAGSATLNGDNSGLSGEIHVTKGSLTFGTLPTGTVNYLMGPSTTLNLKADASSTAGTLGFDNTGLATFNLGIAPSTTASNQVISVSGTLELATGQTLNINTGSNYDLGVTNLTMASGARINLMPTATGENGWGIIVSGTYTDVAGSNITMGNVGISGDISPANFRTTGLVLSGAGTATVNGQLAANSNGATGPSLTAVGRAVTFQGLMPTGVTQKFLSAYDGGSITVAPTACISTSGGVTYREITISGNGMSTLGAGASVIVDEAYNGLTQLGEFGYSMTIGNLALLETRHTSNLVKSGGSVFGANGIVLNGQWNITTNAQSYAGKVAANNVGDNNVTTSNGTLNTVTDLTLTDTVDGLVINSGKVLEKIGAGSLTAAKLGATGPSQMLLNKGAFRITASTGSPDIAVTVPDDASVVIDANSLALTLGSLAGGGATGGHVTLGGGSLVLGGTTNTSYSGVISGATVGSAVVTKSGSGIQTFANANTYMGDTSITGGTLALSGAGTLGSNTSAALTVDGATAILDLGTNSRTVGMVNLKNGGTLGNGTLIASSFAVESGSASAILDGSGATMTKTTTGTVTLTAVNTYTGATNVVEGTLALEGGSEASPISVQNGAFLSFNLNTTITSSSSISLVAGAKIKVVGSPSASSYTLITASGGISGTPELDGSFPGYELVKEGNSIKLKQPSSYSAWMADLVANGYTGDQTPGGDSDKDGMKNLMEYVLNGQPGVSDVSLLPDLTVTATEFIFTYTRRVESAEDTSQVFEYGSDLTGWTPVNITAPTDNTKVTIGAPNMGTPNLQLITVTIPRSGTPLFGRLIVTQ